MLKVMTVALALIVPTQVLALSQQQEFCKGVNDVAFNVAEGRDMGIPIVTVQSVLVSAGLPYKVADSLTNTVYYVLIDEDPMTIQASFYRVCIGSSA